MTHKIVCVTLDMERDHGDPEGHIRLLENSRFLEQYVSIINKYKAKVTMFTVTSLFDTFGEDFRKLAAQISLEFAIHSHSHNPHNACGLDEVQASTAAFKKFTGAAAFGYRAPIGRIDKEGLGHLLDHGFAYDASVYTSIRPGKFGYFNLHMPNTPFRVVRGEDSLVEFPFTSISTVRIVFALSYAKLFGWGTYSALLRMFGLPDVALLLSHPYDFYFHLLADGTHGLEKFALSRNAKKAFDYFENMIMFLSSGGYEFMFLSELYDEVRQLELPAFAWGTWK